MTPLVSYVANVTPSQALINTVWSAIVLPELKSYLPANGSTLITTGGTPIPGPIYRSINSYQQRAESGAAITAGTIQLYELGLDGNWHVASATQAVSASSIYATGAGPGVLQQIGGGGKLGNVTNGVVLGIAQVFTIALVGGNMTYMSLMGRAVLIDNQFELAWKNGQIPVNY